MLDNGQRYSGTLVFDRYLILRLRLVDNAAV